MVCKRCSRVLLPDEEMNKYLAKMKVLEQRYTERQALFKKYSK
jgi:hypothetical protein